MSLGLASRRRRLYLRAKEVRQELQASQTAHLDRKGRRQHLTVKKVPGAILRILRRKDMPETPTLLPLREVVKRIREGVGGAR